MLKTRHPKHYLNVDSRVLSPDDELKSGSQVICTNLGMFGLLGRIEKRDMRKGTFKISFDKVTESGKVHDPFMAHKHLKQLAEQADQDKPKHNFFGDMEIDVLCELNSGITAQLTSSFVVKYKNPDTKERALIDIGLNVKSW